ncbi:MAG: 16S rRNA (cytidine(1402)-2'-O)-methyltransferase [Nitrospirota bacterium]
MLYVVSTPIGNLEDITLRALRILKEVDIIAAEDTRHTRKLVSNYNIDTRLTSYHDYNKEEKGLVLTHRMKEGEDVALVTDAGTPGISDPGYFIINMAIREGIKIVPIPGVSAFTAAISISGLPTDSFTFEGFLPVKRGKRRKKLLELREEKQTLIFFESPYRLLKTMNDILEVIGNRRVVIARELTKIFEETIRCNVFDSIEMLQNKRLKGEITIILEGMTKK